MCLHVGTKETRIRYQWKREFKKWNGISLPPSPRSHRPLVTQQLSLSI